MQAGESVPWSLAGTLAPAEISEVSLRLTAGPFVYQASGADAIAESGVLSGGSGGQSYSLRIRADDFIAADSNTPTDAAGSSYDLAFSVGVVPEPGTLGACLGLGGLLLRRRRADRIA